MDADVLRWDRCDRHLPYLRASRHLLAAGREVGWHGHDFPECTWITRGELLHATAAGEEELGPGDARAMSPGGGHRMLARSAVAITTVSICPGLHQELSTRHGEEPWWPWQGAVHGFHLDGEALRRLERLLDELPGPGQQGLDAEWFVLGLGRISRGSPRRAGAEASCPGWLSDVVAGFVDPRALEGGVAEFVRRTGRNPVYVARLVRRHHGCSTTELVNGIRLEHAARLLRQSDRDVTAVALASGFPNLGYFHRLFRSAYAMTPRAFRQSALVPVGFFRRSRPEG